MFSALPCLVRLAALRPACQPVGLRGGQAARQRLGQHDHAGAAAKRAVVHAAVAAFGPVARVPELQAHLAVRPGAARDARMQKRGEKLGKEREHVKAQGHGLLF